MSEAKGVDFRIKAAQGDARVIHPGDPDHPGEQAKAAQGEERRSGSAVYSGRIAIHGLDSETEGPGIAKLQAIVADAIEGSYPGATVGVDLTRTDR